jgi:hypothetical protein
MGDRSSDQFKFVINTKDPKLSHSAFKYVQWKPQATKGTLRPASGTISLAARGSETPRIGQVRLSVRVNGLIFKHTFEVMDLNSQFHCLMGIDLLQKAGITLAGIPATPFTARFFNDTDYAVILNFSHE